MKDLVVRLAAAAVGLTVGAWLALVILVELGRH